MKQSEWFESFFQKLDEKKDEIEPGDIRFYNIERLPILAKKTLKFSSECKDCNSNISKLDELVTMLPQCMESAGPRKAFEQSKNKIEKHLKTKHAHRFENYFTSLYTLLGTFLGLGIGLVVSFTVYRYLNQNSLLIFTALGLFFGRILGRRRDKMQNSSDLQL